MPMRYEQKMNHGVPETRMIGVVGILHKVGQLSAREICDTTLVQYDTFYTIHYLSTIELRVPISKQCKCYKIN
jgi:hypothetical protein